MHSDQNLIFDVGKMKILSSKFPDIFFQVLGIIFVAIHKTK